MVSTPVAVSPTWAPGFDFGTIEETTWEQWERALSTNVGGYVHMMKHGLPMLKSSASGSIVNIGSISSFIAQPGFVPYNTTKAAIVVSRFHSLISYPNSY